MKTKILTISWANPATHGAGEAVAVFDMAVDADVRQAFNQLELLNAADRTYKLTGDVFGFFDKVPADQNPLWEADPAHPANH